MFLNISNTFYLPDVFCHNDQQGTGNSRRTSNVDCRDILMSMKLFVYVYGVLIFFFRFNFVYVHYGQLTEDKLRIYTSVI